MLNKIKNIKPTKIFTDLETGATFNFFVLAFFTFMGTSLPFQERLVDAYEAETTNILNQIVFIFLFITNFIIIIQNPKKTIKFIKYEKYLTAFIILCLISFLWSNYPFIAFKRSFQIAVTFLTLLNTVLYVKLPKIIFTLKIVTFFYIFITIFSCLLIPAAIDPEFGTWRGIEIHKNLLGHTSLMIFTLSLFFFSESNSKISKYFSITLLFLSIAIIILSGSSTNAIAFLVVSMIWFIKKIDKYFFLLGSSNLFSGIISFTVISAIIILLIYSNELLSLVPGLFGKDLTFTGRDVIWAFIWNEIQHKFWLGYGYGSYWIMGTSVIDLFQAYVGWLVNEAHNGFLEIMLQLGITGLSFFFFILLSFIHKIIKTADLIAFLALVSIIIVNFSESFIFQPRSPSTLVFILFYLLTNYNYQFLVKKTII